MQQKQSRMPALFIGHGSPMNALEDNTYSKTWAEIARYIPKPKAILALSAHWFTEGTRITDAEQPSMVYDMYGFPEALYLVKYPAKGAPELAERASQLAMREVRIDNTWGLDHGAWSVLVRMYPKADIPVFQMSIDADSDAEEHYALGRALSDLRDQGVLILGSGNVVHNLSVVDFGMKEGYPWAMEFDGYVKNKILNREYDDVIFYKSAGQSAKSAFYTPDHFYPLLYVLGASREDDNLEVFCDACTMGSLSMTSYLFT